MVIDNPNLEKLFLVDKKTDRFMVNITKGKVFFHINPKLCLSEIYKLDIKKKEHDDRDISEHTNGDKATCHVIKFSITLAGTSSRFALLKWPDFSLHFNDQRSLLGYLLYYKQV